MVVRYVASLAILLAAYSLYALAAVPLIEPQARFKESTADESTPDVAADVMNRQRAELAGLFPPDAWELNSPKVLAAEQGKLLFRDYEPQPNGRMKLTPCSLVFYAGGSGSDGRPAGRPIVMRAPEGAELQFDRPLNLGTTDIGRMVGGLMRGEITITGRETRPGADDELEIITRNVQLDEERIWTPHEVRFRFGPSHGSGRDLTIALAKGKSNGQRKRGPGVSGLRSLELVHVDKLHLVTSGGGLLPGDDAQPRAASEPPLPVEVTCRGPFRFDFNRLVASFEEQVDVRRVHPTGLVDRLECQLLQIFFGKGIAPAAQSEAGESSRSALSGLEVERLVAVGRPVVLKAGAGGANASGQRFEYDVRNRRILLEDSQKATLRHERHYVEARGLVYELADPGKLGRLWAAGPGRFQTAVSADGKQQFAATWAKELRLRPHQGLHVITLSREASLAFSNQGGIRADDIHIWLHEAPPEELTAKSPATSHQSPVTSHKSLSIQPDKLLALGNVEIESPQLSGRAPRLEAWFQADAEGSASNSASENSILGPGSNGSLDKRARQAEQADGERPEKTAQKFDVSGKLIQIQLLRRGAQTLAENVTVDGPVRLVEVPSANATEPPVEMLGDTLQLFQASSKSARARVTGQPASVSARGMKMAGTNIQMHRGENRVWIDGSGEMVLPAQRNDSRLSLRERTSFRGAKGDIAGGQTITVTWQHRMNFDGQTARFEHQVEAHGETQYARGEVLEVTLNRRIDFSQSAAPEGVDVKRLAFDGGVFLENRTLEEGRLASIEQMQARKLSLDNENGRLNAVGPGWVSSVRREGATSPLGSPLGRTISSTRRASEGAADKLSYLHVDFQTALAGNLVKREVQFLDRVTAVHGPVLHWEQQLSPNRIEELPEQGVLLNCDRLSVREMGQTPVPRGNEAAGRKLYEMEAAGNTRVEGKTFTATADRMTYAQAKDLIVLEGDGRADAELWRQSRVGGPTEHAAARKILFWQRENRAQVDDARFLDLSQFGAPPPREEPRK